MFTRRLAAVLAGGALVAAPVLAGAGIAGASQQGPAAASAASWNAVFVATDTKSAPAQSRASTPTAASMHPADASGCHYDEAYDQTNAELYCTKGSATYRLGLTCTNGDTRYGNWASVPKSSFAYCRSGATITKAFVDYY